MKSNSQTPLSVATVATVQPGTVVLPQKPSLHKLLNYIRCSAILLTDSIPLGDALERIAVAIQRTGVRLDEAGNPAMKEVNRELGQVLLDTLSRAPRTVDVVPVTLGFDPARPYWRKGEALSVPITSECVMLLKKDPREQPVFANTDVEDVATDVRRAGGDRSLA